MLNLKIEKDIAHQKISEQVSRGNKLIEEAKSYLTLYDYYDKKTQLTNRFKSKYDLWFEITKNILYEIFEDTQYSYQFQKSHVDSGEYVNPSTWRADVKYYLNGDLIPKVEFLDDLINLFSDYEFVNQNDNSLKEKIFFNNQTYDAHIFVSDLFKNAKNSIIIIDNFIDETVLTNLGNKNKSVEVLIYTRNISDQVKLAERKFNEQYGLIKIIEFKDSHDRFVIIDNAEVYHFGASLKDLGKKWFVITKMDIEATEILSKLTSVK